MSVESKSGSPTSLGSSRRRSREELVLLTLSSFGVIGVTPFAIYRAISGQALAAAVDFSIVIIVAAAFAYVWRTHKVRTPSIIVTFCYMAVVVAVNHIVGPSLIFWAYPTMAASYFLVRPNEGLAINSIAVVGLLPVLLSGTSMLETAGVVITLALNNCFAYLYARFSLNYQTALSRMASEDPLTGVGNRASFTAHMNRAMAELERIGTSFYLITFDIDHFKRINDELGHAAGDQVLKGIADLCTTRTRDVDRTYRLGGEEFAIVAMGINFEGALHFGEKIRALIADAELLDDRQVTISVGLAALNKTDTLKAVMARADDAMYLAKREGRNTVRSERDLRDRSGDNSVERFDHAQYAETSVLPSAHQNVKD